MKKLIKKNYMYKNDKKTRERHQNLSEEEKKVSVSS